MIINKLKLAIINTSFDFSKFKKCTKIYCLNNNLSNHGLQQPTLLPNLPHAL